MGLFCSFGKRFPIMAIMDVRARVRKTGEEIVYPNVVFENIFDNPDNPLDFIEYVDIPQDAPIVQQEIAVPKPQVAHQQILIDELIKTRNEKLALEQQLKELQAKVEPEQEKKKVGRPVKEKEAA